MKFVVYRDIIYTSILRGVGDSVTPLIALGMTSLIGLMITPILIAGYFGLPKMGIIAPAIATIVGYLAVLGFLAVYLNKNIILYVQTGSCSVISVISQN